ncbi:MAG: hypothetical protein H6773_04630 [Pseudomonadales bacterium]|nr:hypothetical protein [Pseudomonadales bacterium]
MIELFSDSAEQLSNQTTQKSLSGKDKETLRDLARRELVESTSFYLKGVIERSLAAHEGQLDVDDIIDIINLEGKTALLCQQVFLKQQGGRDPILEWGRVSQHIKPRATKDKTE